MLQDSQADLLIYGMGETTAVGEVPSWPTWRWSIPENQHNSRNLRFGQTRPIIGTVAFIEQHVDFRFDLESAGAAESRKRVSNTLPEDGHHVMLPAYEEVASDKTAYAVAFRSQYLEQDPAKGKVVLQKHSARYLVQNPPQRPMTMKEMDRVYALPYERTPHPMYLSAGGVPAIDEVRFSLTSHRGCYGGCNFCAITFHQGRLIQRRSAESIIR